eukprot:3131302-Prymnesium_polylepis.3
MRAIAWKCYHGRVRTPSVRINTKTSELCKPSEMSSRRSFSEEESRKNGAWTILRKLSCCVATGMKHGAIGKTSTHRPGSSRGVPGTERRSPLPFCSDSRRLHRNHQDPISLWAARECSRTTLLQAAPVAPGNSSAPPE